LADIFTVSDQSSQYQIDLELHRLRQTPEQSIQDFYSQMAILWDKQTAPQQCEKCTVHYNEFRDKWRLRQFLMGLHEEFESKRSSLLNQSPTSSLSAALAELRSEETRRKTAVSLLPASSPTIFGTASSQTVLATPHHAQKSNQKFYQRLTKYCSYHNSKSHNTAECKALKFQWQANQQSFQHRTAAVTNDASATESSSFPVTLQLTPAELEALSLYRQSQSGISSGNFSFSSSNFSAFSVAWGKPWLFDSACCNHMTSDNTLFSTITPNDSIPPIHTANGTPLETTHVGDISTPFLPLPKHILFHL
jgi:hypothetical protein